MDDFIFVLVAAGVILILLLAFGTPLADWLENGAGPSQGKYLLIDQFSLGSVGYVENEVSRTLEFGSFVLGETQTEPLKSISTVSVSKGLASEDFKQYTINIDGGIYERIKNVKISFDVGETNLQGDLIIKWNGKTVFQQKANLRSYDLYVEPENIKESNTLEIACDGTFYFWDSTKYTLKNFEVDAEYGPDKYISFRLYGTEKESWNKGVLSFYTTRSSKPVSIKMNGVEIYNQIPEHVTTIEIEYTDAPIKIGDNILVLKSDESIAIDDLKMDVILSASKIVRERDFNITKSDYELIKNNDGEVSFFVEETYKEGVMSVEVNGKGLNIQSIQDGWNSVSFSEEFVSEGSNHITFSGTGGWKISDAKIGVNY
jgi:hypothetical protein